MHWSPAASVERAPSPRAARRRRRRGVDGRSSASETCGGCRRLRPCRGGRSPAALARLARRDDPRIRYVEPVVSGRQPPTSATTRSRTRSTRDRRALRVAVPRGRADRRSTSAAATRASSSASSTAAITAVPDLSREDRRDLLGPDDQLLRRRRARARDLRLLDHRRAKRRRLRAGRILRACRLAVYKAAPLTDVQVAEGIRTLTDAHVRVHQPQHRPRQPVAGGDRRDRLRDGSRRPRRGARQETTGGRRRLSRRRSSSPRAERHRPGSQSAPRTAAARLCSPTTASNSRCSRPGRSTRLFGILGAIPAGRDRLRGHRLLRGDVMQRTAPATPTRAARASRRPRSPAWPRSCGR